jgi:hypothetical protein
MCKITLGGKEYTVLFPKLFPSLTAEERAGLEDDIRKNGVLVPVVIDEDDGIIDGINRLEIAAKLGLDEVPLDVREGLTSDQKEDLAVSLNEHRRHLTAADRKRLREARVEREAEGRRQGKSLRTIAEEEGVSQEQVRRDTKEAGVNHVTPEPVDGTGLRVLGKDGKFYPAKRPRKAKAAVQVPVDPPEQESQPVTVEVEPAGCPAATHPDEGPQPESATSRSEQGNGKAAPFRWPSELSYYGDRLRDLAGDLGRLSRTRKADRNPSDVLAVLGRVRRLADEVEGRLSEGG